MMMVLKNSDLRYPHRDLESKSTYEVWTVRYKGYKGILEKSALGIHTVTPEVIVRGLDGIMIPVGKLQDTREDLRARK